MTYLEELRARYPEKPEGWIMDYAACCCPGSKMEECASSCADCWNREMPEGTTSQSADEPLTAPLKRGAEGCGMTAEREGAILEAALSKWGEAAQAIKAIEELSELQSVLAKWAVHQMVSDAPRYPEGDAVERAVREELADALIMLEQMELVFGDVAEIEEEKLLRLEEDVKDASE